MPTTRKKRSRLATGKLTEDQVQHLVEGWCVDPVIPWYGIANIGFPFKDADHRLGVWTENRDFLMAKYPGAILAAMVDYEGAEGDPSVFPRVWSERSGAAVSMRPLAEVVHLRESEPHDGDE